MAVAVATRSPAQGKRFVLREVVITDVRATFSLGGEVAGTSLAQSVPVTIDRLVLKDIGEKEGGAALADIVAQILDQLLAAVLVHGKSLLPADFQENLDTWLEEAEVQGEVLLDGVKTKLDEELDKAKEKLDGELKKGVGEGLKKLFGE